MEEVDPVEVPQMNSAIAFVVAVVAAVARPSLPRTIDELQVLFRLCMRKAAQQGYTPPAFDDEKFFTERPDLWRWFKPILRKARDGLCQRDMPCAWWKGGAAIDI